MGVELPRFRERPVQEGPGELSRLGQETGPVEEPEP